MSKITKQLEEATALARCVEVFVRCVVCCKIYGSSADTLEVFSQRLVINGWTTGHNQGGHNEWGAICPDCAQN